MAQTLTLYDTRRREKVPLTPEDPGNVRLYACGPTVYDRAHIGNARPIIVFDVLFRLLRHHFGDAHVTYVRNITDVDDKINERAAARGISIGTLTEETIAVFHEDVAALGCLPPTHEPRATAYIEEIRVLVDTLIEKGFAYVAEDHVLFAVDAMDGYGALSRRDVESLIAGARVDVAPYKRGPMDFVLWKPSNPSQPSWPSPGGINVGGRPGWHIECSAMAGSLLGNTFDIHGGGIDLVFPHHENERAQSMCAHNVPEMANIWMHNGFLQVEGRKMSKSEGNFITLGDALASAPGHVLRTAMLMTQYRQPIDWTQRRIAEARNLLDTLSAASAGADPDAAADADFLAALNDDLNTPLAFARLTEMARDGVPGLTQSAAILGLDLAAYGAERAEAKAEAKAGFAAEVEELVKERLAAKAQKRFADADRIRDELAGLGVTLKDGRAADGTPTTEWDVNA